MKKIVFSTNSVRIFFKEFAGRDIEIITQDDAIENGLPSRGIFDVGSSDKFAIIMKPKAKIADVIDALDIADDGDGTLIVVTDYDRSFTRIEKTAQVAKRNVPNDIIKFVSWTQRWCEKIDLEFNSDFAEKAITETQDIDLALSAVITAGELSSFDERLIPFVIKESDIWDLSNKIFSGQKSDALSEYIEYFGKARSAHPVVMPISSYILKVIAVGDKESDTDDMVKNTYFFNKNFSSIGRKNVRDFLVSEMNMISSIDSPLKAGTFLAELADRK